MKHPGSKELEQINDTITKLFAAISFPEGQPPNMHKIKGLFIDRGLLIDYNEEQAQIFGVVDFIEHFNQLCQEGIISGLEDREVYHKTKIYDRIAHRYSFYEARVDPASAPFAKGINSIQLVKIGSEWRISSMAWNDDSRGDGFFKRTMDCIKSD